MNKRRARQIKYSTGLALLFASLFVAILSGCTTSTELPSQLTVDIRQHQLAVQEISSLKAQYLDFMDKGPGGPGPYADGLIDLFVEDATWAIEIGGKTETYQGKAELLKRFKSIENYFKPVAITQTKHITTNPVLNISGDKATGSWQLIMMGEKEDGRVIHGFGFYNDIYKIDSDGKWKIKFTKVVLECCEKGWGEK